MVEDQSTLAATDFFEGYTLVNGVDVAINMSRVTKITGSEIFSGIQGRFK